MPKRLYFYLPLLGAVALVSIFAKGLSTHQAAAPSPLLNKALPAISLPVLGGGMLSDADIKGHYSLINVFASWCVSCAIEHKLLMEIQKAQGIPIYGIAWRDTPENLEAWLEKRGNPYTKIGLDPKGKTIIDLGVTGAPETFLISPEGKVLYRYPGPLTEDILALYIRPLIK